MTDGGTAQGVDARLEHAARVRREAQALRHRLDAATGYAQQTAVRVAETRSRLADEHVANPVDPSHLRRHADKVAG